MDATATIPTLPKGIYRPEDVVSLSEWEHDGQRYYDMNEIRPGLLEVQFSDGEWLLCSPSDLIPIYAV